MVKQLRRSDEPAWFIGGNRLAAERRALPPAWFIGGNRLATERRALPPAWFIGGNRRLQFPVVFVIQIFWTTEPDMLMCVKHNTMETILSLCVGVGLSAACGFRVFVPFLIMSVAAYSGHLSLSPEFQWIGSFPALISFSVATALEIAGYYVPWVDHFLDTAATPAAIVAGTIVTASFVTDVSPFLQWTLAVVAGGGAATVVQATTVLARGASSLSTGGLGNPVFATAELAGSLVTSLIALVAPILVVLLIAVVVFALGWRFMKFDTHRTPAQS